MPNGSAKSNFNDNGNKRCESASQSEVIKVDACGIQCPGPILKLKKVMETVEPGQRIEVQATDVGFPRDVEAWCRTTGNRFLQKRSESGVYYATIEKAISQNIDKENVIRNSKSTGDSKTFILFSDDLDKALATFVLANGVEFIACQMSMDVMGVKKEELLDAVTIGGVATYMDRAEESNVNLFI